MTTLQAPPRPSRVGELLRRGGKITNPLTRHLAGRRFITIWAIVRCRGRRSGKDYSIPIAIGVTREWFVIPLPFAGAQWVRNVLAAGEAVVRWNGREWRATDPAIVDRAEGAKAFGVVARFCPPIHPDPALPAVAPGIESPAASRAVGG